MTNQTNLDYLFKLTAPVSERGAGGATSSNGRRPAFDDHLVNASASASGPSRTAGGRARSNESGSPERDGPASRPQPDAAYAARQSDHEPAENPGALHGPGNNDVQDDIAEPAVSGAEQESVDDGAIVEDESAAEQGAAEQLVSAAAVTEHAAQISKRDSTLAEDQLAESATIKTKASGQSDADAEQTAGNLLAGQLRDKERGGNGLASSAEIDLSAQATIADSSAPQLGSEQTNASNSAGAPANDDNPERVRERSEAIATADDAAAAVAKNGAVNAERKAAKAIATGRRAASQNSESAEERSASGTSGTNRADANASQNASVAAVVANVASANPATAAGAGDAGEEASRAVKPIGHTADGIHLTARAQRSGVAGSRRAHAAQSADLPRVDAARFVGRVVKAVQTAQDRGGLVQLRLSPPELGSLRLELSMQDGVMTAAVETETPAARQVLLDHLPALRERLAEQNIRIERFDVDVRQENSGGQADPRAQQEHRQHQPQQPHSRHAADRAAATQTPSDDAPHVLTRLTNSELNLLA